ncbi:hypothetical protein A9Q99_15335 [Gammaproteobacteria bacterium 45_16_T64]|nr:hypothetical protein A9Q99_15335 [Gammaproteobacteria bacterium 45_16_T64]
MSEPLPNQSLDHDLEEHWAACHDCDLLLPIHDITENRVARCPRCNAVLYRHKKDSMNRTLAFSIAALLFYIPANTLPILSLDILGNTGRNTMLNGVLQLWQQGSWWMAFLVAACSVAMPLLELGLLAGITGHIQSQRYSHWLPKMIKWQHRTSGWAMLEVYLLGIIVAIVKMSELGDLVLGQALVCFVVLLVFTLCALQSFDRHEAWHRCMVLRQRAIAKAIACQ